MENDVKFFALSGFLGQTSDWNAFVREFALHRSDVSEYDILAVTTDSRRGPAGDWFDWSRARLNELQRWKNGERLLGVGYSLGGRLLLSIASLDPFLFDGLVFLSVNPGLADLKDKQARLLSDREWARRFAGDDWNAVLKDWNAQPVFQGGKAEPERKRRDYSRTQVSRTMTEFSLALQPDYSDELGHWRIPQLWLAGEKDTKFRTLLDGLQRKVGPHAKQVTFETVPSASHRILIDEPERAAQAVAGWIGKAFTQPELPKPPV